MNTCARGAWALMSGIAVFCVSEGLGRVEQEPLPIKTGEVFMVDDFDYKVTPNDMGFNSFSGNMGDVSSQGAGEGQEPMVTGAWSPLSAGTAGGCWQIGFNFSGYSADAFCGKFLSLFGLTATLVDLTGTGAQPAAPTAFAGSYVNFNNLFGSFAPWQGRTVDYVGFETRLADGSGSVIIKVQLEDEDGNTVFGRVQIVSTGWGTVLVPRSFFNASTQGTPATFRWDRVSLLSFIVERRHVGDHIANPDTGGLLIDNIRLVDADGPYPDVLAARDPSTGALLPQYRDAFLDHVRKLSFLYFLDFASTDARTGGLIQDRGTFADLISVGGAGFQLTAYVIGAERGYISREEAAGRVAAILRVLGGQPQGPAHAGTIGHKGLFYHFLGIDGLRKQNFDFDATADVDESLNTVELSAIDTALAVMGIITAKQYFRDGGALETEVRTLAEEIVRRVDWAFLKAVVPGGAQQVCLGWKPNEPRDDAQGRFRLPDGTGQGFFSSKLDGLGAEVPATLDYYTDEGLLIALLGMAAPDAAKRLPRAVWDDLIRQGDGFVKTYPGSLFTYQFLSCWVNTGQLGTDNHPTRPVDFFENTRQAILATRTYAVTNAVSHPGVGSDGWGFSACEGPYDAYAAEAAPSAALAQSPAGQTLESGTLTPYATGGSVLHLPDEAVAALWHAATLDLNADGEPDLLHPRFGFADAFNEEIASAAGAASAGALRQSGTWANMTGFAIDQGPLLILLDNALGGNFVPQLFMSDTNIHRVLSETFPATQPLPSGLPPVFMARSPLDSPVFLLPGGKATFRVRATDSADPDAAGRGMASVTWTVDGVVQQVSTEGAPGDLASAFVWTAGTEFGYVKVRATALDRQGETSEVAWDVLVTDQIIDVRLEATAGAGFELSLAAVFPEATTLAVVGLPPGLSYNAATGRITGVPTQAGVYTVSFFVDGVLKQRAKILVEGLPAWAQGAFNGYLAAGGSASISVTSKGKLSGKVAFGGTNYAFSAVSYASGDSESGFEIAATAKAGKAALPLALTVWPATNGVAASLGVAAGTLDGSLPLAAYRNVWKDAGMAGLAAGYAGYYTATLAGGPEYGSGYLTFTLDQAGKVKAAGKLADGTAVSQSGTLILDGSGRLLAVVYAAPTGYKGGSLFGLAEFVRPEAGAPYLRPPDGAAFLWSSRNPAATAEYGTGFSRDLPLAGGWYSKTENLYAYYAGLDLAAGTDTNAPAPELTVGTNRFASVWWNPAGIALTPAVNAAGVMTGLTAPAAGKPTDGDGDGVWDYGAPNASGLKISLARPTGIFKGSFLSWFDYPVKKHASKSMAFEGALTPVREDPEDGVEGRGYFLWADKAAVPATGKAYSFKWSYDFLILGE